MNTGESSIKLEEERVEMLRASLAAMPAAPSEVAAVDDSNFTVTWPCLLDSISYLTPADEIMCYLPDNFRLVGTTAEAPFRQTATINYVPGLRYVISADGPPFICTETMQVDQMEPVQATITVSIPPGLVRRIRECRDELGAHIRRAVAEVLDEIYKQGP